MRRSLQDYNCGPLKFSGERDALYERHLLFGHVVPVEEAAPRQHFEALATAVRDVLAQRWIATEATYRAKDAKRVYYLSMEFLLGRMLADNLRNLGLWDLVAERVKARGGDLAALLEREPDAGLGNGGLGRLAACFMDSLATLGIPSMGYGLRYEYGLFRQEIEGGRQVEVPDHWLARPDPWEVWRPEEAVEVRFGCDFTIQDGMLHLRPGKPQLMLGIPCDRPVVGYGGGTIGTLRLWQAATAEVFDFQAFRGGDLVGALAERLAAESVTKVLYPDDSTTIGQGLRFLQEYFLAACSIADLVRRFRRDHHDWSQLPRSAAVQMNDTHPAIAVVELMRVLLDDAKLGWEESWDLTVRTLSYTNHTLLPEALEKWSVRWFERLLPRHLEIVYEINRRFLDGVRRAHPGDAARAERLSLVEEKPERKVRMAHLAVLGSHRTNGVAEIHSRLVRETVLSDMAGEFPERFTNKTNGVTPRRWLLGANPGLAALLTETLGEGWPTDFHEIERLRERAGDPGFQDAFLRAKRAAKVRLVDQLRRERGIEVDPEAIFDCQIKRIHEYKRQLLNALHAVQLYRRLRENPRLEMRPRVFFFAGKAAPSYRFAKIVIKFLNDLGRAIDADPAVRAKLRVLFLPNYSVSLAEALIPAADVSEQISTAGYEASGTSNMKFMMNGALTVGTRDGATIEMAEAAGEENFFLFGLDAAQVATSRDWYSPRWHYDHEPETRAALDLVFSGHFDPDAPEVPAALREALLDKGDPYRHLADLRSYAEAQARVDATYSNPREWARKAILNVASSGRFSSDRTIAEYAREIWGVSPCAVDPTGEERNAPPPPAGPRRELRPGTAPGAPPGPSGSLKAGSSGPRRSRS